MSDSSGRGPGPAGQNRSIVDRAVQELELVLAKTTGGNQDAGIRKGANALRKRNALGRGLSALMSSNAISPELAPVSVAPPGIVPSPGGNAMKAYVPQSLPREDTPADEESDTVVTTGAEGGLMYLPIGQLVRNENQPRQVFSEAELNELTESIQHTGLLQPILVRTKQTGATTQYEIVAGERRYRAALKAGLEAVPALVRELSDRETLELAIVENVQRSQLNAIEEAEAYFRLQNEFELSQEAIAKTVGKDRVTIANALRLLKLPPSIRAFLADGSLTSGHARALLMVEDPRLQQTMARTIIDEGLSVRTAETMARGGKEQIKAAPAAKSKKPKSSAPLSASALEERFRRALGTKVKLNLDADGKGELRISFFSREELEKLIDLLNA